MKNFKKLTLTLAILPLSGFADTLIHINVNGLVCDFCAQAVEKVFVEQNGAHHAKVDLENGMVELCFADGTDVMDDAALAEEMTDAGYTATNIHRMEEQDCNETH